MYFLQCHDYGVVSAINVTEVEMLNSSSQKSNEMRHFMTLRIKNLMPFVFLERLEGKGSGI